MVEGTAGTSITKGQALAIGATLAALLVGVIALAIASGGDEKPDVLGVQITRSSTSTTAVENSSTVTTAATTTSIPSPTGTAAPTSAPSNGLTNPGTTTVTITRTIPPTTLPAHSSGEFRELADNGGYIIVEDGQFNGAGSATTIVNGEYNSLSFKASLGLRTTSSGQKVLVTRVEYKNNTSNTISFPEGTMFIVDRDGDDMNLPAMNSSSMTALPGGASGFIEREVFLPGDGQYSYQAFADVTYS